MRYSIIRAYYQIFFQGIILGMEIRFILGWIAVTNKSGRGGGCSHLTLLVASTFYSVFFFLVQIEEQLGFLKHSTVHSAEEALTRPPLSETLLHNGTYSAQAYGNPPHWHFPNHSNGTVLPTRSTLVTCTKYSVQYNGPRCITTSATVRGSCPA